MVYRLIRVLIAVPILRMLLRPRVRGLANVPRTGPVILAGNHVSLLDPVLLSTVVSRPISYVVKAEYFTAPGPAGRALAGFFRAIHQVPVDRSGGPAADAALRTAATLLARGEAFGIFPEGTRSPDGLLHRGRTGVARIALATGAPVVPVGLIGTADVLARGSLRIRLGRPEIRFGPALIYDADADAGGAGFDRVRIREVTDEIMAAIGVLSGQSSSPLDAREVGPSGPDSPADAPVAPEAGTGQRARRG